MKALRRVEAEIMRELVRAQLVDGFVLPPLVAWHLEAWKELNDG